MKLFNRKTQCVLCRHAAESGAVLCPSCREAISRLMMIGEWEAAKAEDKKRNRFASRDSTIVFKGKDTIQMSEDNTNRVRNLGWVYLIIQNFEMLEYFLSRLDVDILDEDSVKNLRLISGSMRPHIERLDDSTRKLLD